MAAAVIQRCYRKYKQVTGCGGTPKTPGPPTPPPLTPLSLPHKLTWIALKVTGVPGSGGGGGLGAPRGGRRRLWVLRHVSPPRVSSRCTSG